MDLEATLTPGETRLSWGEIGVGDSKMDEAKIDEALSVRDESSWVIRSVLVLIALATVYAGITIWLAKDAWLQTLGTVSWRHLAIVISLIGFGLIIRATRWHYYLHVVGWRIPLRYSLSAFISSIALTATPGKAGELIKFFLLRSRFRVSIFEGSGVLLIERLGDLAAVIILAAGGLTLFIDLRSYLLVSIILVLTGGLIIILPRLRLLLLLQLTRIPRLRKLGSRLIAMGDTMNILLRPLPCLVGAALALVAWSCEAFAFYYLLDQLHIATSPVIAASIFGFATLAGVLSMLPGGIGGFEVVMGLLLTRLGTSVPVATVAIVLFRGCSLWLFSAFGLAFLLGWLSWLARTATKRS